jgi:FkbM family methyltransferase
MNSIIEDMENSKIFIYGTGTFARQVFESCNQLDLKVEGYVDHIKNLNELGLNILSVDELPTHNDVIVILGVCNLFGDLQKISDRIFSRNSSINIVTPVQFAKLCHLSGLLLENYWLSGNIEYLTQNSQKVLDVKNILSDAQSQDLFDKIVKYRIDGFVSDLPKPESLQDQYLPLGLSTPPDLLNMLELGSFKGEDLKRFLGRSKNLEFAICIEPDLENYIDLVTQVSELRNPNLFPLPVGAWNVTSQLKFDSNGQSDARVSEFAESSILVIKMDELIGSRYINYIKMDIEGAEIPAIDGLKNTISKQNPHLAISVYHKPQDILEIPLKINEIAPGAYDFFMRVYGHQTFETVLYCIPRD